MVGYGCRNHGRTALLISRYQQGLAETILYSRSFFVSLMIQNSPKMLSNNSYIDLRRIPAQARNTFSLACTDILQPLIFLLPLQNELSPSRLVPMVPSLLDLGLAWDAGFPNEINIYLHPSADKKPNYADSEEQRDNSSFTRSTPGKILCYPENERGIAIR